MTEAERTEKRVLQAKKAQRKHRLLIGSTWSILLTAFAGFFVLWNHLGASSTQAAVSQTGSTAGTAAPTTARRTHHHRDDSGNSGNGFGSQDGSTSQGTMDGNSGSLSGGGADSGGSAVIIPSQGSDFTSSAS